jgi:hypothetical protein
MRSKKGEKMSNKHQKKGNMFEWLKKGNIFKWLALGLLSLVVIFILIFWFVPLKQVPYQATETYQTTETYYVKEVYTTQEPYTVQEPYTDYEWRCDEENVPLKYSVVDEAGYNFYGGGCGVEVYILNWDNQISGTFTVTFFLLLQSGETIKLTNSVYIPANDIRRSLVTYDFGRLKDLNSYSYSITPPTKLNENCRYVEVTRYRTVTEYREVTKERYIPKKIAVLKTRLVTLYKKVSLFKYLTEY